MDITINKNLRTLRREKGNTQEELAVFLGVTVQAISKWERNEGLPDITLLPAIASFYNVSIDDLMGFGEMQKEQRIKDIFNEEQRNANKGDVAANVELLRSAYKEFPYDFRIIISLMKTLWLNGYGTKHHAEIFMLGEKIINECSDNMIKYEAIHILSRTVMESPDGHEKAIEYAMTLPELTHGREITLIRILRGEALVNYAQEYLQTILYIFQTTIHFMLSKGDFSAEEFIQAKKTVIKFYELFFDDGDMGYSHFNVSRLFQDIVYRYAEIGQVDKMFSSLEHAYKHAKIYDSAPKHRLNSLLARSMEYDPEKTRKQVKETACQVLIVNMKKPIFDNYRSDERFVNIINHLEGLVCDEC